MALLAQQIGGFATFPLLPLAFPWFACDTQFPPVPALQRSLQSPHAFTLLCCGDGHPRQGQTRAWARGAAQSCTWETSFASNGSACVRRPATARPTDLFQPRNLPADPTQPLRFPSAEHAECFYSTTRGRAHVPAKQHSSRYLWSYWLTWLSFAFTSQWKISGSWVPCQGMSVSHRHRLLCPLVFCKPAPCRGSPTLVAAQVQGTQAGLTPRCTLSVSSKQSTMKISWLHGEVFGRVTLRFIDKDFCCPAATLLQPGHVKIHPCQESTWPKG